MWDRISGPLTLNLGIDRLAVLTGLEDSRLPKKIQQELLFLEQQPKFLKTVQAEDSLFEMSGAQAVAAGNLGGAAPS